MPPVAAAVTSIVAAAAAASTATVAGISLGATAFAAFGTVFTVGQVIGLGITVLGGLAQSFFTPSPSSPSVPPQARLSTINQPRVPRSQSIGRVKNAGSFLWYGISQEIGYENNLTQILAMDCQKVDQIEEHYLNNERVTLDSDGWVQTPSKWQDRVRIVTNDGDEGQPALAEAVEAVTEWTSAHRGRGIAQAFILQKPVKDSERLEVYPRDGRLQYTQVRRGPKVYDLRNPLHDLNDPETWEWSDNAALCTLHRALHIDGSRYTIDDIHLPTWTAWADHCDELIVRHDDSTEARYRAWGIISLSAKPREVLAALLKNADAVPYLESGLGSDGQIRPQISVQFGAPAVSADQVYDEDTISAVTLRKGPGLLNGYNKVVAEIVDPLAGYQEQSVPAVIDPAAVAARGNREQVLAIKLDFCPSPGQGQRLAKKELLRQRPAWSATVQTSLAGMLTGAGRGCDIELYEVEHYGNWRVTKHSVSRDGVSIDMDVVAESPQYDVWTKEEEVPVDYPPPLTTDGQQVAAPTNVSAAATSATVNQSVSGVRLRAIWDSVADETITKQIEYTVSGSENWTGRVSDISASAGEGTTEVVEDGQTYDVRVRHLAPNGTPTDWVVVEDVLALASSTATAAPQVSIAPTSVDEGQPFTITLTAPDESEFWRFRLFRNGVEESPPITGTPGQPTSITRSEPVAGSYSFKATAENISGVQSSDSNIVTVNVTSSGGA